MNTAEKLAKLETEVRELRKQRMMDASTIHHLNDAVRSLARRAEILQVQMDARSVDKVLTEMRGILARNAADVARLQSGALQHVQPRHPSRKPARKRSRWTALLMIALVSVLFVVGSYLFGRMVPPDVALLISGLAASFSVFLCLSQLLRRPKSHRGADSPSTF